MNDDDHDPLRNRISSAAGLPPTNGLAPPEQLTPDPWIWCDPATIPPRQWLLGSMLLRGYCTLLSSQGGVGKTSTAINAALAVITQRRDICDMHPFVQGAVWYITLEDDELELHRRIAAAMIAHQIQPQAVAGWLYVNHPTLTLLTADRNGAPVLTDHVSQLANCIKDKGFVLVVIDPLIQAHNLVENSNDHMNAFIAATNQIARDTGASFLLPHHFHKGGNANATRDAARGASSLIDGARIALNLLPMSDQEAQLLGVKQPDLFVRLVNAKTNMAPPGNDRWFQMKPTNLGNTNLDPAYPAGDTVQALLPYSPTPLFNGFDRNALANIFNAFANPNTPLSPARQAPNWAGSTICALSDKSPQQASAILKTWISSGVLTVAEYRNDDAKTRSKILLNQPKADLILRSLDTNLSSSASLS